MAIHCFVSFDLLHQRRKRRGHKRHIMIFSACLIEQGTSHTRSLLVRDASQRTQGFLCLFGGLMIAFAKEILTAIGAI